MHNLRIIFLCVLFATQISTMELSQNLTNKRITIPAVEPVVKTLKQLAMQCAINHLELHNLDKEKLPNELKKALARQYYLQKNQYIFDFKDRDFRFALAELVNHGLITISSDQKKLDLGYMQIDVIHSLTLQIIANKCPFLTSLHLSDNELAKLPYSIGQLTKLEIINLEGNQLTELPDSIGRLTTLTALVLRYNKLAKLPDSMSKLVNLSHLNLSNNQLAEPPGFIGQLVNLKWFNLSNNLISKLPNSMSKLVELVLLFLDNNRLSQKEQEKIRALLPNANIHLNNQQEDSHA